MTPILLLKLYILLKQYKRPNGGRGSDAHFLVALLLTSFAV